MTTTILNSQSRADQDPGRISNEELNNHAAQLGIDASLINVQDIVTPDCVTITIAKPDGRSLRRVVPRECWEDPEYRSSLIRDMGLILA